MTKTPRSAQEIGLLKLKAINEAMSEVLKENKGEVIRKAAMKLQALGIKVTENELKD